MPNSCHYAPIWDIGQVYYRFDSDPSLTADSTDDFGIVTGLRYEF